LAATAMTNAAIIQMAAGHGIIPIVGNRDRRPFSIKLTKKTKQNENKTKNKTK
jgi:hypothetical protein